MATECPVCREVTERSTLYGRWLIAENYGDGATLEAAAAARGFCTIHAARLIRHDPDIAVPIAGFVLAATLAALNRQLHERRGYHDAFEPSAPCPWCAIEREATAFALSSATYAATDLCQPHAHAAAIVHRAPSIHSPFAPGMAMEPFEAPSPHTSGWSWMTGGVTLLWESLRVSCASCEAAREAGIRREAFLRAGPQPREHWEVPELCVAHDVALGRPSGEAFLRAPDGVERRCDWCSVMERAAARTTELFAIAYAAEAFRLAYASVPGLCLPHSSDATRYLTASTLQTFAVATRTRVAATLWEIEERGARGSWTLRDQSQLAGAGDLPHRAWWLVSGGMFRWKGVSA